MFFYFKTKNLSWEILTKNLVKFRQDGCGTNEKFWYLGGSLKNPIFEGGGITKNQYNQ